MPTSPILFYVEDDPSSIKIMKLIVENVMKISSLTIFKGSEGFPESLNRLDKIPDIFLLDIHITPYDGFDMLAILRADKRFKKSKIIAVTASVMGEEVDQLKQSGFDGAISKPLNIQTFPDLIARVMKGETVWFIS